MELPWLRHWGLWVWLVRLNIELDLTRVDTHGLHFLNQLFRDLVCHRDVDHLSLAFLQNALSVLELSNRSARGMVSARDSNHGQQRVEYVLAEAAMRLAIIHKHLLKDLFCCHAPEAARFGPRLINDAVPRHPIGR